MKRKMILSAVLALAVTFACAASLDNEQKNLSDKLLRLHVVGASNLPEDQELKIKIKDEIVSFLRQEISGAEDKNDAEKIVLENLENINVIAKKTGEKYGKTISVKSQIKREAFPTRGYDTFSLPAGFYTSLRVTIDEGEGKNWWCVVYPDVCASLSIDGDNYEELGLSCEEAGLITKKDGRYEIKFRFIEIIENLKIAILGK